MEDYLIEVLEAADKDEILTVGKLLCYVKLSRGLVDMDEEKQIQHHEDMMNLLGDI